MLPSPDGHQQRAVAAAMRRRRSLPAALPAAVAAAVGGPLSDITNAAAGAQAIPSPIKLQQCVQREAQSESCPDTASAHSLARKVEADRSLLTDLLARLVKGEGELAGLRERQAVSAEMAVLHSGAATAATLGAPPAPHLGLARLPVSR